MKVGDLVKFVPDKNNLFINDRVERRQIGTVLGFDIYRGKGRIEELPSENAERIVEVLWNIGTAGWILESRVEVIQ